MRIKHHRQIVDMLYDEWDLGKTAAEAKGKACAWFYWFEILNEAEAIITEKSGGEIIGVSGYTKWHSRKHWLRKSYYGLLKWLLLHSFLIKNRRALEKYDKDYDYSPPKLTRRCDGELTILIVNKQHRGQGLGRKLLEATFDLAARDHLKNLQILSDESCNYQFYEKLGCRKIWEKDIPNGEPDQNGNIDSEKGFIYEKILAE